MKRKYLRKLKKVTKIIAKIELELDKKGINNELKDSCRKVLDELDDYIIEQTGNIILRHFRYITLNIKEIEEGDKNGMYR